MSADNPGMTTTASSFVVYCNRCRKVIMHISDIRYVNYANNFTSIRCIDCFDNIGAEEREAEELRTKFKRIEEDSAREKSKYESRHDLFDAIILGLALLFFLFLLCGHHYER